MGRTNRPMFVYLKFSLKHKAKPRRRRSGRFKVFFCGIYSRASIMPILNGLKTISKPIASRFNTKFKRSFSEIPKTTQGEMDDIPLFTRLEKCALTFGAFAMLYEFKQRRDHNKWMDSQREEILRILTDHPEN